MPYCDHVISNPFAMTTLISIKKDYSKYNYWKVLISWQGIAKFDHHWKISINLFKKFANIKVRIRSHFHIYFGKCKMFLEGPKMMFIYAYNLNFNYLRIEALSN